MSVAVLRVSLSLKDALAPRQGNGVAWPAETRPNAFAPELLEALEDVCGTWKRAR